MGFGLGLDASPRQGALLARDDARLRIVQFSVTDTVLVLTPGGTPPMIDLGLVGASGDGSISRNEYAERLVRRLPSSSTATDPVRTERSIVGDARDLLVHVMRTHLGRSATASTFVTRNDDDERNLSDMRIVRCVIRVGTPRALVRVTPMPVMRDLLAENFHGRWLPSITWDGSLDSLDADGYVQIGFADMASGGQTNLLLAGGSPYGTHHAVTDFLRDAVGAEWLFPGSLGEVIPQTTSRELRTVTEPNLIQGNRSRG